MNKINLSGFVVLFVTVRHEPRCMQIQWSTTWTMGVGNISDTLTVHFYDWDDQLIGDIVFKKN